MMGARLACALALWATLSCCERKHEEEEPVEAEPKVAAPKLLPKWGARAFACKEDDECALSSMKDGDCCLAVCETPYAYTQAFDAALDEIWRQHCEQKDGACRDKNVVIKCDENTRLARCRAGRCVAEKRRSSEQR